MNPREKLIVKILYESQRVMTAEELSILVHASVRTIRNDIKNMNDYLKEHGCSIATKTNKGMWLVVDSTGKIFIENTILPTLKPINVAYKNRMLELLIILFDEDEIYYTIQKLADKLYISQTAVVNELKGLSKYLDKHALVLSRIQGKGIRIDGDERKKRVVISEVLQELRLEQGSNYQDNHLKKYFGEINLPAMNEILTRVQQVFQVNLSVFVVNEIIVHTLISNKRSKNGKYVVFSKEQADTIKNHTVWKLASFYLEQLDALDLIEFVPSDFIYIAIQFMGINLKSEMQIKNTTLSDLKEIDQKLYTNLLEMIGYIDLQYNQNFKQDIEFLIILFYHMYPMIERLRNGILFKNPMIDEIKLNYAYAFEISAILSRQLSTLYEVYISEDEIAYISLHIGASLERNKQKTRSYQTVAIVCASGMGSSQLLAARFQYEFPYLRVIDTLSVQEYENRKKYLKCDFIVSTIPLVGKSPENHIVVSPLLNQKDICNISTFYKRRTHTNTDLSTLFTFLNEDICLLGSELGDKQDVLKVLGNRMVTKGYGTDEYVDRVLEREELASTSIGGLIALPHPYESKVKKEGIGLLTLKKPIVWGDEKVQIILMLAMDVQNQKKYRGIYREIAELLLTPNKIAQIIKAKNYMEITRIMNKEVDKNVSSYR